MSVMTKIEGVADSDDAIPGMAFFAGTGPFGETCKGCAHRGYYKQSETGKTYRVNKCAVFKRLSGGRHGADIKASYSACKYFELRAK